MRFKFWDKFYANKSTIPNTILLYFQMFDLNNIPLKQFLSIWLIILYNHCFFRLLLKFLLLILNLLSFFFLLFIKIEICKIKHWLGDWWWLRLIAVIILVCDLIVLGAQLVFRLFSISVFLKCKSELICQRLLYLLVFDLIGILVCVGRCSHRTYQERILFLGCLHFWRFIFNLFFLIFFIHGVSMRFQAEIELVFLTDVECHTFEFADFSGRGQRLLNLSMEYWKCSFEFTWLLLFDVFDIFWLNLFFSDIALLWYLVFFMHEWFNDMLFILVVVQGAKLDSSDGRVADQIV